ncbi:inner membrane protein YpjD [Ferrimonas balearica]|uniref:cytochrome C assembly family protein n=1 Tax=Ferrimonas balearica TaxID=44012 RepID=UPI001C993D52|nr:cytochrome c biogenesis protein CcsA [Ferrimonas balearica]MBY5993479.1 cytochrome c biogenesis protein CcsA [Ferrimonas balearica]
MELFAVVAILGYAIAFYLLASRLLAPEGPNRKLVTISAGVAVVGHALVLGDAILMKDGQNFSLTNTLSLLVWIITVAITVTMPRLKVLVVAPAVYLCAILAVVGLWLLPPKYITHFEAEPMVLTHVVLALLSYAVMLLAALYAIQLAGIDRRLKQRQIMLNPALPPLMTVEKQLYHLTWIGFVLLTLGLLTGWVFLEDFLGDGKGHKAILSMVAWVVYGIMLLRHHTKGMRIRSAVAFTFSGAALLTLAYFGSRVVKELILT